MSNITVDEELKRQIVSRLRAYRHADTDDVELLVTTIERPDAVEIKDADQLTEVVTDSFLALITRERTAAQTELLDEFQAILDKGTWTSLSDRVEHLIRTHRTKLKRIK